MGEVEIGTGLDACESGNTKMPHLSLWVLVFCFVLFGLPILLLIYGENDLWGKVVVLLTGR